MLGVVQRQPVVHVTVGALVGVPGGLDLLDLLDVVDVFDVLDLVDVLDVVGGVDGVAVNERAPGVVVVQMLGWQHRQRQHGGDRANRHDESAGTGVPQEIQYRGARRLNCQER